MTHSYLYDSCPAHSSPRMPNDGSTTLTMGSRGSCWMTRGAQGHLQRSRHSAPLHSAHSAAHLPTGVLRRLGRRRLDLRHQMCLPTSAKEGGRRAAKKPLPTGCHSASKALRMIPHQSTRTPPNAYFLSTCPPPYLYQLRLLKLCLFARLTR